MDPVPIKATLAIDVADATVVARLELLNVAKHPAFVLMWNAGLTPELENDVFEITARDGTTVHYSGRLAKRSEPTLADFRLIEPGQSALARVRLDTSYAFPKGPARAYSVVYSAFHPYPGRPGIWKLVSNEVHFTHGH
jgi:peptidyl-Lys metalloendopeptidase